MNYIISLFYANFRINFITNAIPHQSHIPNRRLRDIYATVPRPRTASSSMTNQAKRSLNFLPVAVIRIKKSLNYPKVSPRFMSISYKIQ